MKGPQAADASPSEENSASVETDAEVEKVLNVLDLRDETKKWLKEEYKTLKSLEDFIQMSSEKVKDMLIKDEEKNDGSEQQGKNHARFNQADRAKLILLRRWMKNKRGDGDAQKVEWKWEDFDRDSFETFVNEEVLKVILDEILKGLQFTDEIKDTLSSNDVITPGIFVEKSKYWYKHEMKLKDADIHKIEKFKKWYKYQLDTYLTSDWIVSFRKEAEQVKELEWRKVLKAIGLKADAIQALEINEVCDFATLNHKSKKWKISEPSSNEPNSKKIRGCISDSGSPSTQPGSPIGGASGPDSSSTQPPISNTEKWDGWKTMGLKENDARHIINFRHWHKFYVARKKNKGEWTAEFSSTQYERFVQRYIDPSTLDEFEKPGWWASKGDRLKQCKEKKEYYDMLEAAAEDGVVTEMDRCRLRQHFSGRREKIELIQEINEGVGGIRFQEKRLGEIIEEEAATDRREKARDVMFSQKFCQFYFCALIAYLLLWCWVGTGIHFVVVSEGWNDWYQQVYNMLYRSPTPTPVPTPSPAATPKPTPPNDYMIFIHNITFGLVTAVVIQELGEEVKKTSVYHRFLPVYEKLLDRLKKKRFRAELERRSRRHCCCGYWGIFVWLWEIVSGFVLHVLTWFILYSTRFYIFFWIVFGAFCLIFGIATNLKSESPIYTTGQTWIGIAVTIAYSYFGLKDKNTLTIEDAKDAIDQRIKDAVQGAIGGDSGEEEAKFTDERGGTKVIRTYHELKNEIKHYEELRKKAADTDACNYQKCLDQLEMLKPSLPTVGELESQLKEAKEKRNAAGNKDDVDDEDKYHKEVIKLRRKLKEEEAAAASGDASSS
jgi:hypothetical protein